MSYSKLIERKKKDILIILINVKVTLIETKTTKIVKIAILWVKDIITISMLNTHRYQIPGSLNSFLQSNQIQIPFLLVSPKLLDSDSIPFYFICSTFTYSLELLNPFH